MVPVVLPVTTQNRVRGMIELRECVRNLIMYQTEDYPDHAINAEQSKLNRLYDGYTKKYGLINSRGNSMAFSQDSAYDALFMYDKDEDLEPMRLFLEHQTERTWEKTLERERRRGGEAR